jgi:choline kinase
MRAIILAAGTGSRMRPMTDVTNKCCLPVGGKPLLNGQVQILSSCGITDVLVVTGYCRRQVMEVGGHELEYLFNPFFATTNSIVSLWLARHYFTDNVIVLNCDVIFDAPLIYAFMSSETSFSVAVCRDWSDDRGYKAEIDEDGHILRMGMNLARVGAEYGGIMSIKKAVVPDLVERMEIFLERKQCNVWYEDVVSDMLCPSLSAKGIYVVPERWYELDTLEEYKIANDRFKEW